jgi:fluoroquinolone resistance protein
VSFAEKSYYQEKFARLSLSDEVIKDVIFEECEFNRCSFITCKFEKCKFLSCRFNGCNLSAINLANSRFIGANFAESNVIGIDWTLVATIEDLEFSGCQINYSNFKLLKLPKIKMVDCTAKEVDFTETDLSQGTFTNTDFEMTRFFKTNLTGADFKSARNYFIDVRNNTLKDTRFSLPEAVNLLKSLDIILE